MSNPLNVVFFDDDGLANKIIAVTRNDKTRTFHLKETAFGKMQQLSSSLQSQDDAKRQKAFSDYGALLIASSVTEDGEKLTFDKAVALPFSIGKRLEMELSELNSIASGGAEVDAKNE